MRCSADAPQPLDDSLPNGPAAAPPPKDVRLWPTASASAGACECAPTSARAREGSALVFCGGSVAVGRDGSAPFGIYANCASDSSESILTASVQSMSAAAGDTSGGRESGSIDLVGFKAHKPRRHRAKAKALAEADAASNAVEPDLAVRTPLTRADAPCGTAACDATRGPVPESLPVAPQGLQWVPCHQ